MVHARLVPGCPSPALGLPVCTEGFGTSAPYFLETLWKTSLKEERRVSPAPSLAQAAWRGCTGPSGALMESTADKGERSAGGQSGLGGGLLASSALPQGRASWGEGLSAPWGPGQFKLTRAGAGSAKWLGRCLSRP